MAKRADSVLRFVLQSVFQVVTEIRVVIQDSDVHLAALRWRFRNCLRSGLIHPGNPLPGCERSEAGRVTSRQAPPPSRFDAEIVPSCWCTMPSATVNPRPVPRASRRVDTNASKISGKTSAGMPGPLSSTVMEIQGFVLRTILLVLTSILPDGGMAYSEFLSRLTKTCIKRSGLPITVSSARTLFTKLASDAF